MSDIFEADELEADAVTEHDEAPADKGPERGEDGKFKAREPVDEQQGDDPDAPPEGEEGKPPSGTVPQGALHAERERRKTVETELAAAKAQLAAIAQMREQIASRQPAALPAADDPAALGHLTERLAQIETQQTQFTQQRDAQALDQAEMQQLGAVMSSSEAQYRQAQPDYDDALTHLVNARANELQLYGLSPAEVQQTIAEEATEIVRTAVQRGQDPAEMAYKIAQSRGYRPAQGGQQQGGGATAMLAALDRAQGVSKSLGSGGGSGAAQINAEAIAAMSQDEFERFYSTPEGKKLVDAL